MPTAQVGLQTFKYGPFHRGFVSSVLKKDCPRDAMADDSVDLILDPVTGAVRSRLGSSTVGNVSAFYHSGIVTERYGYRSRQIFSLTPSNPLAFTTGYPTHAVLLTSETAGSRFGTVAVYHRDDGVRWWMMAQYVQDNTVYRVVPIPYTCGSPTVSAMGMTRGVTAGTPTGATLQAHLVASGSRSCVNVGKWLFLPDLYGSPIKWNRDIDIAAESLGTIVHPWGMLPPLTPPRFASAAMPSFATAREKYNWADGDATYYSVIFENENGEYSMPFVIRPPGTSGATTITNAQGGLQIIGTVRTGSTADMRYYEFYPLDVPKGPHGTVARLVCRTNKVNLSSSANTTNTGGGAQTGPNGAGQVIQEIDLKTLRVTARIPDNSTTRYNDFYGNDGALFPDEGRIVRFDRIWPPSCRHTFEFDRRVGIGYRRINPAAIIVAPTGQTASGDLALLTDSDSGVFGTWAFGIRIVSGTLQLNYFSAKPAAPATTSITLSASITLQQVVDAINATLGTLTNGREWAAQLAPGVAPDTPSSNLLLTSRAITCTSSAGSPNLTSAAAFGPVAVGMLVSGTNIGSESQVMSRADDSNLVMSVNASGGGGALSRTFSVNTGGNFMTNDGTFGHIRSYCPSLPVVIPFSTTYLESLTHYEDKQEVLFTIGSPSTSTAQAQSFVLPNRRKPTGNVGIFMGGAPLAKGALLCYSRAIFTLENRRGGNTGEDFDYHLFTLNPNRGAISAPEAVGDGWVGYWTGDGYFVTDGEREVSLSGAIHNVSNGRGELAAEIAKGLGAAAADNDDFYGHSSVQGGVLEIMYRSDTSLTYIDRRQKYDFSPSLAATGLDELVSGDQPKYGWSAPLVGRWGPLGSVSNATGRHVYCAVEGNDGVGDGRVDEIDKAGQYYDEGGYVTSTCSWTGGLTALTGDLSQVAVGAQIQTAGGMSQRIIATKSADDTTGGTVTVASGAGGTNVSLLFAGKEIEPRLYLRQDFFDTIRGKKSVQSATILYKHTPTGGVSNTLNSTMTLRFSRDKGRITVQSHAIDAHAVGEEWNRLPVPLSQDERTLTDVGEFQWWHDGRGASQVELFELEAEVEVMESDV